MTVQDLDTTVIGLYGIPVSSTAPLAGQVLAYNGTNWYAQTIQGEGVYVDVAPPVNPSQGDLWWDTISGQLFIYYEDPQSSQWVAANANAGPAGPPGPPGSPGPAGPAGSSWLVGPGLELIPGTPLDTIDVATPYLPLAGGILTGPVTLAGNATANLNPVPLQQMTTAISAGTAGYLPLTGGTLTGPLTVDTTAGAALMVQGAAVSILFNDIPGVAGAINASGIWQTGGKLGFGAFNINPDPNNGWWLYTDFVNGTFVNQNLNASGNITAGNLVTAGGGWSGGGVTLNNGIVGCATVNASNTLNVTNLTTLNGGLTVGFSHPVLPGADGQGSVGFGFQAWSEMCSYAFTQSSDPRLKEDIGPVPTGLLDEVLAIPVHNFRYRSDATRTPRIGFDASEVQGELPVCVRVAEDEDKTLGLDITAMLTALWGAVQELAAKVEALESA